VREQLCDGDAREVPVQPLDMATDGIVQRQAPAFAQQHDASGGEGFGVRGDAEAVARGQRFGARQVGGSKSLFQNDATLMGDGDGAAREFRLPHLEFDPARNVVERGLEPGVHGGPIRGRVAFHAGARPSDAART